jgi:hypothetical protein
MNGRLNSERRYRVRGAAMSAPEPHAAACSRHIITLIMIISGDETERSQTRVKCSSARWPPSHASLCCFRAPLLRNPKTVGRRSSHRLLLSIFFFDRQYYFSLAPTLSARPPLGLHRQRFSSQPFACCLLSTSRQSAHHDHRPTGLF